MRLKLLLIRLPSPEFDLESIPICRKSVPACVAALHGEFPAVVEWANGPHTQSVSSLQVHVLKERLADSQLAYLSFLGGRRSLN